MGHRNVDLAALIGSRICHDLISPIGAINNGLELFGMAGTAHGPELDLIGESVGNASARIKYFRIAFGAAGEQQIGRAEISSVIADFFKGSRLDAVWGPVDAKARSEVRLALLAVLCLESAMPYGGRIEIAEIDGRWQISGSSEKLNFDEALWAQLATPNAGPDLRPAEVQFALLPVLADDLGRKVTVQLEAPKVTIRF